MTKLYFHLSIVWSLVFPNSLAGAAGRRDVAHVLRHRSPIDIVLPHVDTPPPKIEPVGTRPSEGPLGTGHSEGPESPGSLTCPTCGTGIAPHDPVAVSQKPSALVSTSKNELFEKFNDWADALQECVQLAIPSSSGSDSSYTGTTCSQFNASCPVSIFNTTDLGIVGYNTSISPSFAPVNSSVGFQDLNDAVDQACGPLDISQNIVKTACNVANVVECIQGVSQTYQDWYSWVSSGCQSWNTPKSNYTVPPTMPVSASQRTEVRIVDLLVLLLVASVLST